MSRSCSLTRRRIVSRYVHALRLVISERSKMNATCFSGQGQRGKPLEHVRPSDKGGKRTEDPGVIRPKTRRLPLVSQ